MSCLCAACVLPVWPRSLAGSRPQPPRVLVRPRFRFLFEHPAPGLCSVAAPGLGCSRFGVREVCSALVGLSCYPVVADSTTCRRARLRHCPVPSPAPGAVRGTPSPPSSSEGSCRSRDARPVLGPFLWGRRMAWSVVCAVRYASSCWLAVPGVLRKGVEAGCLCCARQGQGVEPVTKSLLDRFRVL